MLHIFPSVSGCYFYLICLYWSFYVFLMKSLFSKDYALLLWEVVLLIFRFRFVSLVLRRIVAYVSFCSWVFCSFLKNLSGPGFYFGSYIYEGEIRLKKRQLCATKVSCYFQSSDMLFVLCSENNKNRSKIIHRKIC